MRTINPGKAALSLGAATGSLHLIWSVLVASGVAKAVIDFILMLHFIAMDVQIQPFNIRFALVLIALTSALGGLFGYLLALIWNGLAGGRRSSLESGPRRAVQAG